MALTSGSDQSRLAKAVGPLLVVDDGGANFSVGHGFTIRFPAAGWYTADGEIVEGKGVSPDFDLALSAEALRAGKTTS